MLAYFSQQPRMVLAVFYTTRYIYAMILVGIARAAFSATLVLVFILNQR